MYQADSLWSRSAKWFFSRAHGWMYHPCLQDTGLQSHMENCPWSEGNLAFQRDTLGFNGGRPYCWYCKLNSCSQFLLILSSVTVLRKILTFTLVFDIAKRNSDMALAIRLVEPLALHYFSVESDLECWVSIFYQSQARCTKYRTLLASTRSKMLMWWSMADLCRF
jgi:hypothetical protein